jgi:hypothetical protein
METAEVAGEVGGRCVHGHHIHLFATVGCCVCTYEHQKCTAAIKFPSRSPSKAVPLVHIPPRNPLNHQTAL